MACITYKTPEDHRVAYERSASLDTFDIQAFQCASVFRRQMSLSSSMSCRLCGKRSVKEEDWDPSSLKANLLLEGCDDGSDVKKLRREGCGVGRKTSFSGDEVCTRILPKWKQLLRRLVAEARKMKCSKRCPGFNYDPLSYAMNFDEGCWQCDLHGQSFIHSMRFSSPSVLQVESFQSQSTEIATEWNDNRSFLRSNSISSLWQRRKVCEPPLLSLKIVKV